MTSNTRTPLLPDVPTFIEAGVPLRVIGLVRRHGARGNAEAIIARLNCEIVTALAARTEEALRDLGTDPVSARPSSGSIS